MANYELDIQHYNATHNAMWLALTKISYGGYHYCDRDSVNEHTVTVKDGTAGPSVTLYIRECDLYIVGFEGAGGKVFAFGDQAPRKFSTRLEMSVNYAHVPENAKTLDINHKAVVNAITTLAGYSGTAWGVLSQPFLIMALLVSEAMRFKPVFNEMAKIVRSSGAATTKFNVWAPLVTTWSTKTTSLHAVNKLMEGPSQQAFIKTWHRFDR